MSIETVLEEIAALRSDVKSLSKIVRKIKAKQDDPTGEKAASRAMNNGFNRKQAISEKLRAFLDLPQGELVSRSTVTKAINKYVTDNGLKNPDNGRILILDDKLRNLLEPPPDVEITFLNLVPDGNQDSLVLFVEERGRRSHVSHRYL